MKITLLSILALLIFALSCNSELEDPDAVDPNQQLILTVSDSIVTSGGLEKVKIFARVPEKVGRVEIIFSSSAGIFTAATPNAKFTVKQIADSVVSNYRFARADFISDAIIGDVYITAEARSARTRIKIQFK
jgi:hypothetical protein